MSEAQLLMTEQEMDLALKAMAEKIVGNGHEVALIGIRSRGVPLANWLAKHVETLTRRTPKIGALDINLYRDDLSEVGEHPIIRETDISFKMEGTGIILVDDVLYTGRTIRAALDAIIDFGRPKYVRLAVLVDRGWRELPIEANWFGKKVETTAAEVVKVMVKEIDGKNEVVIKQDFSKRF